MCSPNPCPQPTGACCFDDGSCQEQSGTDCINSGGVFRGIGSTCSDGGDDDSVAAVCDNCPDVSNADQLDSDGDSHGDACDNCTEVANMDQVDSDDDRFGNACDPDKDCDLNVDAADLNDFVGSFSLNNAAVCDLNGDGVVGMADYAIALSFFGQAPGPSCCGSCM